MAERQYRAVAEKLVAVVHAIADLTQELSAPPTPRQISEATGIPPSTLSRLLSALEKSGDVGRVYGGRGLVLQSSAIDDLAIMRSARGPLTTVEQAVLDAITALQRALGPKEPITLLAITAHILDTETRIIERSIRELVASGHLIEEDGGYRPAPINI